MGKRNLMSRRNFLIAGGMVGGGLAIAYALGGNDAPDKAPYAAMADGDEYTLNAYVKIAQDGTISVAISQAEMGQGIHTALCMLIAEELEVDVATISPEQAPIDAVYANFTAIKDSLPFSDGHHRGEDTVGAWAMEKVAGMLGVQATGGSTSVRNFWMPMQHAGAAAREMLISAAAAKWNVPASECFAENAAIKHRSSDRIASYGELAEAASNFEIPADVPLKAKSDRKIIGKSQARLDIPAKVTGEAGFGMDVRVPNMVFAAVKMSPVFGGTVQNWDEQAIVGMPGVL